MDPKRLKEAYRKLEDLDERLSYKVRPRRDSLISPSPEQLDARLRDLAQYTMELKDAVHEFLLAFAKKPAPPSGIPSAPPGGPPAGGMAPGGVPPGGVPPGGDPPEG